MARDVPAGGEGSGKQLRRDLKAMRIAAKWTEERMAAKLGLDLDIFRRLEAGDVAPNGELLAAWQRAVALALIHAARHQASASRGLRRWRWES
jgi:DNA-binding XRE family transcriptional regulator